MIYKWEEWGTEFRLFLSCSALLHFSLLYNLYFSLYIHVINSHLALLYLPVQGRGTSQQAVSFLSSRLPTLKSKDA